MNKIVLFVLAAFVTSGSSAQQQPWPFVESVGGVSVGSPVRESGEWVLPIEADVSGLSAVTLKPLALNSGLSCRETRAVVRDKSIFISLVTGVAGAGSSAKCPPAKLGKIPSGAYNVFYGAPGEKAIELKEIQVEP